MKKEDIWQMDGVGLAKDHHGKTYLLVDGTKTEAEALRYGKEYFKCAKSQLKVEMARIFEDELFSAELSAKKSQLVWQITREAYK